MLCFLLIVCLRLYVLTQYSHLLSNAIRPISFHPLFVPSYEHELTSTMVALIFVLLEKNSVRQHFILLDVHFVTPQIMTHLTIRNMKIILLFD